MMLSSEPRLHRVQLVPRSAAVRSDLGVLARTGDIQPGSELPLPRFRAHRTPSAAADAQGHLGRAPRLAADDDPSSPASRHELPGDHERIPAGAGARDARQRRDHDQGGRRQARIRHPGELRQDVQAVVRDLARGLPRYTPTKRCFRTGSTGRRQTRSGHSQASSNSGSKASPLASSVIAARSARPKSNPADSTGGWNHPHLSAHTR